MGRSYQVINQGCVVVQPNVVVPIDHYSAARPQFYGTRPYIDQIILEKGQEAGCLRVRRRRLQQVKY